MPQELQHRAYWPRVIAQLEAEGWRCASCGKSPPVLYETPSEVPAPGPLPAPPRPELVALCGTCRPSRERLQQRLEAAQAALAEAFTHMRIEPGLGAVDSPDAALQRRVQNVRRSLNADVCALKREDFPEATMALFANAAPRPVSAQSSRLSGG